MNKSTPVPVMLPWALCTMLALGAVGAANAKAPKKNTLPAPAIHEVPPDALPGLTPVQIKEFLKGKVEFGIPTVAAVGLGPVYNGRSCGECHPKGEGSTRTGNIIGDGSPLAIQLGGPVIQVKAIPGFHPEKVPNNIPVAVRRAMTTQGLGLIGNIPDSSLQQELTWQLANTPLIAGKARQVTDAVTHQQRIGRVGQKCQHPNSTSFAAEASLQELGITTPFFPKENAAYNNPANLVHNPRPGINDVDGRFVIQFGIFMDLLAPPSPNLPTSQAALAEVQAGQAVFVTIGCGVCHKQTWTTGPHQVAALNQQQFHPYSDFLLHDMGVSGDQVQQGTDTNNQPIPGTYMRTTPLWGVRLNPFLWHDGRVKQGDFEGAINQHAGQGQAAKTMYQLLTAQQKQALLAFLNSL